MAVFFDLDGTLLDDDAAMRAGALAILTQHRAAFDLPDDAFARQWKGLVPLRNRRPYWGSDNDSCVGCIRQQQVAQQPSRLRASHRDC